MANDPMAASDVSLWVSIGAIVGSLASATTVLRFWTRYSDRVTRVEGRVENAMQEAAEAKNDTSNLRELLAEMTRNHVDAIESVRHERGEGLVALRQHVTDLAFFVRDNFVRQPEFATAMKKIEDGQARLESKLDEMREKMHP